MQKILIVLSAVIVVAGLLMLPSAGPAEAQAGAVAATSGFGAAFAYSQNIGWTSMTSTGSIGNGAAAGFAVTPWSWSWSEVWTSGPAGAMAQAIGTPFGSTASTQVMSLPGGFSFGAAFGN